MLKNSQLGIVGSGRMAEAMIIGLLKKKLVKPGQIIATGPRVDRGAELKKKHGVNVSLDNTAAAKTDLLILAVKPQTMSTVLTELNGKVSAEACVLSIAAGITLNKITAGLQVSNVARAMPNTPGRINQGVTVWTATSEVSTKMIAQIASLLSALGVEVFVEEERYLDMATALSGSGPAYVLLFMEVLVDAGVRMGLPRYLAELLVKETLSGTAAYAKATDEHLAKLRNEVTSPAGTSAEALYQLDEAGFRTAIARAVQAAYQRSVELGS